MTTDRYAVWDRKERGRVSPTFPTREEARRWLGEHNANRFEVRKVDGPAQRVA